MPLSSYRMHKIYLAATMNYGLGSNEPEELAYYNKIRKEMDDMKKEPVKRGISVSYTHLVSSTILISCLLPLPPVYYEGVP